MLQSSIPYLVLLPRYTRALLQFIIQMNNMHSHEEERAVSPTPSHTEEATAMVPEKPTKNMAAKSGGFVLKSNAWRLWDILALIFALAILVAIIVILYIYDKKEQPNWKYMSLNTLLSWLSTVCKGSILLPASAALSQFKWVWFAERKRPLSDLKVFDSASRGMFGSAEMLWALRMRYFAVLGALATILSIGLGPFIQNLVNYSATLIEDTSFPLARLANSTYYDSLGPVKTKNVDPDYTIYDIDLTLKANIYNSIFNADPAQPWSIPHYDCATGNCTWNPVPSIAMRALCSNISSHISNCDEPLWNNPMINCSIGLEDGVKAEFDSLFASNNKMIYGLVVGVPKTPIVYTNATFPVIQRLEEVKANTQSNGTQVAAMVDNISYMATECTLQPIVRSVNVTISESRYEENIWKEWDLATTFKNESLSGKKLGISLVPDWKGDFGNHAGQNFTLSPFAKETIDTFITSLLSGNVAMDRHDLFYNFNIDCRNNTKIKYATDDTLQALLYGNISGCADPDTKRFECVMDNMARAMSKTFRDQAYVRDTNTPAMTRGITMTNAIIVHVHWQWMTLPLLLWLLVAVSWVGAVWKTHQARVPKWYESPFPLLFLYRGEDDGRTQDIVGDLSVEAYEAKAKEIEAQLQTKENQAAFIVSSRSSSPVH